MTPEILAFARKALADFAMPIGRVIEVGSYNVNGSVREVFQERSSAYIGIDIQAGPGVDLVMDATNLDCFVDGSFDTVISCECLEHVVRPWIIVEEMKRVLAPGGFLFVSTPTYGFPLHRFPIDTYRYGEDAYRLWLFADMELLRLEIHPDHLGQPIIMGIGRKLPNLHPTPHP